MASPIADASAAAGTGPGRPAPTISVHKDRFDGRVCKCSGFSDSRSADVADFGARIVELLAEFRASSPPARGVWVEVPSDFLMGAMHLRRQGFRIHHADDSAVTLTAWLPDETKDPNLLPDFAHTYCGVGALVVRGPGGHGRASDDPAAAEVLVVRERWAADAEKRFKFPGGAVDRGERLCDAVVREAREETGIVASFVRVVAMEHFTSVRGGNSDLYVACLCEPADPLQEPEADPLEIAEARWMPVAAVLADPRVYPMNKELLRAALADLSAAALPGGAAAGMVCEPRSIRPDPARRAFTYDHYVPSRVAHASGREAVETTSWRWGVFAIGAAVGVAAMVASGLALRSLPSNAGAVSHSR